MGGGHAAATRRANHSFARGETDMVGGAVWSADIAVPEHDREQAFYASVLTTGGSPRWQADLLNNEGTPIIGLGPRSDEYDFLPLQWMPHIQVTDVGASVTAARDSGAEELMHSRTDDGQSQWAVLKDPEGAAFGLIPLVPDQQPPADNVGRICWLSRPAADTNAMAAFYQQVAGWNLRPVGGGSSVTEIELQTSDGATIGAIVANTAELPTVWMIHLPVGDLAASLGQVRDGGGAVLQESGTPVRRAIVRDPVGACFALQEDVG